MVVEWIGGEFNLFRVQFPKKCETSQAINRDPFSVDRLSSSDVLLEVVSIQGAGIFELR